MNLLGWLVVLAATLDAKEGTDAEDTARDRQPTSTFVPRADAGVPVGPDGGANEVTSAQGQRPASDGGSERPAPIAAPRPPAQAMMRVEGRVLARGTRKPIVAALIALDPRSEVATETDPQGFFALQVPSGTERLYVQCPGYYATSALLAPGQPMVIRLEPRTEGERYTTVVTAEAEAAPSVPLGQDEIRKTAGSMGDPFRVVESLPGVTQAIWPLPLYAIRGANPGNTGYFIDNVRAPALFHFALGPSVIHPFFLEQVEFFPGGYPVDKGRYVSGIVTAQTATPPTDRLHLSADVRLFDAGGILATPFNRGKGAMALAGRYSYTGFLLSSFSNAYALDYWDYQARIEHSLGPGKLTLFAFGSGDSLRQKQPDIEDWGPGITQEIPPGIAELTFHRAQIRWDGHVRGAKLHASAVAGSDDSKTSLTSVFTLPIGSRLQMLASRLSVGATAASWLDFRLGADGEIQWITPSTLTQTTESGIVDNYQTDLFSKRRADAVGGFFETTLRLGSRLTLVPGLRYDLFWEEGATVREPSPRLSVRWQAGNQTQIKATVGQYAQLPSLPLGVPGFESFGLKTYGLQRSRQASLGVASSLEGWGMGLTSDVTVFYQRLRLSDMRSTLLPDPQAADLLETREAESYGVELLIRRPSSHRLYGWLAYTLSYSNRLVDGIIAPSDWDQRHILNLVLGYRLPQDYSVSVRFHYNTGRPYPLYDERSDYVEYSRLPSFPQLDLRGDKRIRFDTFVMEIYLEVINATLSREVYDRRRERSGEIVEDAYRLVLPSAGLHIEW